MVFWDFIFFNHHFKALLNQKVILAKILELEVRNPNKPSVSLVLTIFISKNAFSRAYCKSQVQNSTIRGFSMVWFGQIQ